MNKNKRKEKSKKNNELNYALENSHLSSIATFVW